MMLKALSSCCWTARGVFAVLAMCAALSSAGAQSLPDPTRPPMPPANAGSPARTVFQLRLEAIIVSGGAKRAIVDGKVVREGDRVSGALIEAIGIDSVRYSRGGQS